MVKNKKIEVLGVGTPILDHLLYVSEEYLEQVPGEKHGMEVVDYKTIVELIEKSGDVPEQVAGGSCANAIKGLASLGHRCAVTGKVGKDVIGEIVRDHMQDLNIETYYAFSQKTTAHVLCLITPDGKRTLRCYMGAGAEMTPEDLRPEIFEGVKWVHIEGYTLLCPGLTRRAMELAKNAEAKISFDLGSFEMVRNYREYIISLLDNYVDVVFSNQDEIHALVENGPEEGCRELTKLSEVAIVMLGAEGCLVGHDNKIEAFPALPIKPLDTTGAGDLFASGFLHGYLTGRSLKDCARFGSITGGTVIQYVGAEIPKEMWPHIMSLMT